jgi:predicted nucleotidyltransferase component of viral defense system
MTKRGTTNIAASVHQRLLNLAKTGGRPFNELLVYYAIERFLYRLSISRHAESFVLKGALTLLVWQTPVTRPTRDIDLLGRTSNDLEAIRILVSEVCKQAVDDDGLIFDSASVATSRIAEDADYEGVRAIFQGKLGNARIAMQIDIGFSDVITPAPVAITYPVILDQPAPHLMAYNRETAIAEKLEAMVSLGELNTRMKDFFDVWLLARSYDFDGRVLAQAVTGTFGRRHTPIDIAPVCFAASFAASPTKAAQWNAFVRNSKLTDVPGNFADVVAVVAGFAVPVLVAVAGQREFNSMWERLGTWRAI